MSTLCHSVRVQMYDHGIFGLNSFIHLILIFFPPSFVRNFVLSPSLQSLFYYLLCSAIVLRGFIFSLLYQALSSICECTISFIKSETDINNFQTIFLCWLCPSLEASKPTKSTMTNPNEKKRQRKKLQWTDQINIRTNWKNLQNLGEMWAYLW